MSTNEEIAARIKKAREKRGISQKTLAEMCGWAQSRIGNYESGARGVGADDAIILSRALDMSPAEIMFGEQTSSLDILLQEKERKLLELFKQLPESDQDKMIDLFRIRLKEIDDYVEKYLRGRFTKMD
ncbi:transcriptional regulator [Enterobacter hormaechei]|jgi:transcriptional regulator with XRE-family HTH domain|uniref:Helix-turn-helix domain-containing protein n=1 Tax=Phytobacter ursingii TaxID=1972431 RepID=A0AB35RSK1_9ENTR|nr:MULTISPECIES: helix-turn-helix domain-containing protein [Enterobacteriaceae]AUV01658.1 transcriptional regulator [Enterobacteriaceae bacterium ENNIH1]MDU4154975.1 helix-turn-helix domain-containing protein [Enterobacteriaceae bacterium]PTA96362.1 helix-turn-helix domain-containing protein [Kluyvera sp. Nf5]MDV2864995.1 helix-turn-helix domain-containing protein [Phytobacter ursingii]GJL34546.1 transcriptional regulator [Enterobacter hormaechei]